MRHGAALRVWVHTSRASSAASSAAAEARAAVAPSISARACAAAERAAASAPLACCTSASRCAASCGKYILIQKIGGLCAEWWASGGSPVPFAGSLAALDWRTTAALVCMYGWSQYQWVDLAELSSLVCWNMTSHTWRAQESEERTSACCASRSETYCSCRAASALASAAASSAARAPATAPCTDTLQQ